MRESLRLRIGRTGVAAAAVALLGCGCMSTPFDGQRVSSLDKGLVVSGFHATAGAPVEVQAFDAAGGTFVTLARTDATRETGAEMFGQPWYSWSVRTTVPRRFHLPGARGAAVRLRARDAGGPRALLALQEDGLGCVGRAANLAQVGERCSGLEQGASVICSHDYLHPGSRRGPCPRRTVDVLDGGGNVLQRHVLADTTQTVESPSRPHSIRWRGDAASFVDIFDASFASRRDAARIGTAGLTSGSFVRLHYSRANTDTAFDRHDIEALARALVGATPWSGAVTIRHYDIGECSYLTPWRRILDSVDAALRANIAGLSARPLRVQPLSRAVLTPVLRTGASDALRFTQSYSVYDREFGVQIARFTLRLTASLAAAADQTLDARPIAVAAEVEPLVVGRFAEVFGSPSPEDTARRVEAAVRERLPGNVRQIVLEMSLGQRTVKRVHARPEGLELVLAESIDDPLYPLLSGAGMCSRPSPSGSAPQAGYFDSVFDPPLPGDPPVFGDR